MPLQHSFQRTKRYQKLVTDEKCSFGLVSFLRDDVELQSCTDATSKTSQMATIHALNRIRC